MVRLRGEGPTLGLKPANLRLTTEGLRAEQSGGPVVGPGGRDARRRTCSALQPLGRAPPGAACDAAGRSVQPMCDEMVDRLVTGRNRYW